MNWRISMISIAILIFAFACGKNADSITSTLNKHDSIVPPGNPIDSSDFMPTGVTSLEKWRLIKDSISNPNSYFYIADGKKWYPQDVLYIGVAGDFWNFRSDSIVNMHKQGLSFLSKYKFYDANKIVINEMLVIDTGRIVKHTNTDFIIDWKATSSNGGNYYRRIYLAK